MLSERERLTIEAARRLLRSRLRQHLFRKADDVERRRGHEPCFDLALDAELGIEAAAEAAWISTVKLWGTIGTPDSPHRDKLQTLTRIALASAVENSKAFIVQKTAEYENEDVKVWVLEFIDGFDPRKLVEDGGKPCASGT